MRWIRHKSSPRQDKHYLQLNFIKRDTFQHGKKCTHCNDKQKQRIVFFRNALIEPAFTQPDLGLYFSSDLNWNLRFDMVCGKQTKFSK